MAEHPTSRALNSAVECHLHTVEVIGSNPIAPTTSPSWINLGLDSHVSAKTPDSILGSNWHQRSWMTRHILSLSANPELGQLRAMVLRQAGYSVNWPANKEEADKLLENESFDVLLIGDNISGQSARHFAEAFRTRNPQGKIVAITPATYLMIKADKTVKSVYGPEALLGAIEDVLGPQGLAKCS